MAEIEGGRPGATDVTHAGKDRRQGAGLTAAHLGVVGEPGGHQCFGQVDRATHADRQAVTHGAVPGDGRVCVPGHSVVHHPDRGAVVDLDPDRYAEGGVAIDVVRGAVERIDDPAHAARPFAQGAFFTQQPIVGPGPRQGLDNEALRLLVDPGNQVGDRGLALDGEPAGHLVAECGPLDPRGQHGELLSQLDELTRLCGRRRPRLGFAAHATR